MLVPKWDDDGAVCNLCEAFTEHYPSNPAYRHLNTRRDWRDYGHQWHFRSKNEGFDLKKDASWFVLSVWLMKSEQKCCSSILGFTTCSRYYFWSVICINSLPVCRQQTDTAGGASTDEAEGRRPLVPGGHPQQGANWLQPQVNTWQLIQMCLPSVHHTVQSHCLYIFSLLA